MERLLGCFLVSITNVHRIVITTDTFLFFRHWKSYESIHNPVIKVYCITCTLMRTSRQPKRALASLPYLTACYSL